MTETADPIPLSALNHYVYCPRRCGLIHMEGEFTDNIHTARGNAEHGRVDRIAYQTKQSGARVEYALPVWSDQRGLIGKCDVVEFWPDGTVYPVEYKHGSRHKRADIAICDDVQLAAQALCLEEMFAREVPEGALYYASSRRRRIVRIDAALRARTEASVTAVRRLLQSGETPSARNDAHCRACSLNALCQPQALSSLRGSASGLATLFTTDD